MDLTCDDLSSGRSRTANPGEKISVDVVQAQRMHQLTRRALLTSIFAAIAAIMGTVAAFLSLFN
jgi:hypothetical protein